MNTEENAKTSTLPVHSRLRTYAWVSVLVTLSLFALLTWLVLSTATKPFDQSVLLWLNTHARSSIDTAFIIITELGGTVILTLATILLAAGLLWRKKYLRAGFVAATVGGSALLNFLLKGLFERARPELWERLVEVTHYSFPSGHSISSSVFAFTIIILVWRTKWRNLAIVLGVVYILTIGLSRLYLGVHYPTDVLGGWLLGYGWVALVGVVVLTYILPRHTRSLQ